MIGYHSSNHLFDKPDYELIVENRVNHSNGNLGLWFSTTNDWQQGFGGYTYELTLAGNELRMNFTDFKNMCDTDDGNNFYQKVRDKWLSEEFDYLLIVENDGRIGMGIVLNFDSITVFKLLEKQNGKE